VPRLVSRDNAQGYTGVPLAEIFKADVARLPAYAGAENAQGGFLVFKITRVVDSANVDPAKRKAASDELRQVVGQEELNAYVSSLRLKSDIKVQQDQLEKKPQQ
jgi:peptidyl-prolyl cis-trans isomerase D